MSYIVQHVAPREIERERQRALDLGGSIFTAQPAWAAREQRLIASLAYRRGFALELLRDLELKQGCPPIRTPEMLRAAGVLVGAVVAQGADFFSLSPARFVQSRTCEWYVQADQLSTINDALAAFGASPLAANVLGSLTQRVGLRVETVTPGVVGVAGTTVRWSLNNGASFTPPFGDTIPASSAFTPLGTTGISLSLNAGTLLADNAWEGYLGGLGDLSGFNSDVNFVNGNTSTAATYTASLAAIRNMACFNMQRARSSRFLSAYNPPPPGTSNLFFSMVLMVPSFFNTATLFACSTTDNIRIAQVTPNVNHTASLASLIVAYPLTTWLGTEWYFSNSIADRVRIGATPATGTNTGNGDGTACCFGARTGGTLPADVSFAAGGLWQGGDLTALELAWTRAFKRVRFNAST